MTNQTNTYQSRNPATLPEGFTPECEFHDGEARQVVAIRNPSDGTALGISAESFPLPTGAATSAKQDTLLAELQLKADLTETQPITPKTNYFTEIALGNITGRSTVNKFGAAPDGIQVTATDVWSRADSTPTQQIWLAPTAPRVHALVSSSAADVFNLIIYGLKTWDTAESSETIALNGQTPVNTVNSYVIIHRMKCVYTAAKTTNVGTITATAATDNTITAVILPGDGQTEMAIYGVPSTKKALMHRWACQINKTSAAAVTVNFTIKVNENPQIQTVGFLRKNDLSLQSNGASAHEKVFDIPPVYSGPCIIKVQGVGSAADIDASSGFDLELVDV